MPHARLLAANSVFKSNTLYVAPLFAIPIWNARPTARLGADAVADSES